jgi:molybdopterin-guanine dinucleotide biosynthesis protein A
MAVLRCQTKISAVLLAGGQSRRMGRDKATIIFRGKPLWQIQFDLLRKLQPAEILVSARIDPVWRPPDVMFIPDKPPSRGPLSGLITTLAQIRNKHLLALAVDMPFMTERHLRFLCNQIQPGCGVLPMIGDLAEPLAAIYPIEAHNTFSAALSGVDFSMQALTSQLAQMRRLRVIQVPENERGYYRNLNEPDDMDEQPDSPIAL